MKKIKFAKNCKNLEPYGLSDFYIFSWIFSFFHTFLKVWIKKYTISLKNINVGEHIWCCLIHRILCSDFYTWSVVCRLCFLIKAYWSVRYITRLETKTKAISTWTALTSALRIPKNFLKSFLFHTLKFCSPWYIFSLLKMYRICEIKMNIVY